MIIYSIENISISFFIAIVSGGRLYTEAVLYFRKSSVISLKVEHATLALKID